MRRKQKNKRIIVIAIALLLLISIGYAAISTTLRINGTANIAAASWSIYFTNLQTKAGSVTPSVAPTVSGTNTTTLNYTVTLEEPGDFYEFTVDVKNGGTINAKIANILNTPLTPEQDTYVNYTVTYLENGTPVATPVATPETTPVATPTATPTATPDATPDATPTATPVATPTATPLGTPINVGDKLAKSGQTGDTKTIKVRVEYDPNISAEQLNALDEDMTLSLTFSLDYVQD